MEKITNLKSIINSVIDEKNMQTNLFSRQFVLNPEKTVSCSSVTDKKKISFLSFYHCLYLNEFLYTVYICIKSCVYVFIVSNFR